MDSQKLKTLILDSQKLKIEELNELNFGSYLLINKIENNTSNEQIYDTSNKITNEITKPIQKMQSEIKGGIKYSDIMVFTF